MQVLHELHCDSIEVINTMLLILHLSAAPAASRAPYSAALHTHLLRLLPPEQVALLLLNRFYTIR